VPQLTLVPAERRARCHHRAKNEMLETRPSCPSTPDPSATPDPSPGWPPANKERCAGQRARLRCLLLEAVAAFRRGGLTSSPIQAALAFPPLDEVPGHESRPYLWSCARRRRQPQPLCVVGDDDQSISSGAARTCVNILGLNVTGRTPPSFTLEQNYRSTPSHPRWPRHASSRAQHRAQ